MPNTIKQRFPVHYSFPVTFTRHVFAPENQVLEQTLRLAESAPTARMLIFIDSAVAAAWPSLLRTIPQKIEQIPGLEPAGEIQTVPGGEQAKDGLAVVEKVGWQASTLGLDRHSFVLAIGGGAVLDAVGLGASLVHRGLRLVRMPSTVLAQNDAGIGVKNGVNACDQKNFFGTFAPPWAVINDLSLLETLPDRHWRSGIAEAVKVACIKDADFFDFLTENAKQLAARDMATMEHMVRLCAELHLEHTRTAGDPFEAGSARPLDFGHWSAHWLEIASRGEVTHGEGVAIGIAIDIMYARETGLVSRSEAERVIDCLETCGFTLQHELLQKRDPDNRREVFQGLERFREHLGGRLTLILPAPLGRGTEIHEVDLAVMDKVIERLTA